MKQTAPPSPRAERQHAPEPPKTQPCAAKTQRQGNNTPKPSKPHSGQRKRNVTGSKKSGASKQLAITQNGSPLSKNWSVNTKNCLLNRKNRSLNLKNRSANLENRSLSSLQTQKIPSAKNGRRLNNINCTVNLTSLHLICTAKIS